MASGAMLQSHMTIGKDVGEGMGWLDGGHWPPLFMTSVNSWKIRVFPSLGPSVGGAGCSSAFIMRVITKQKNRQFEVDLTCDVISDPQASKFGFPTIKFSSLSKAV